jgi:hypothetical protein
METATPNPPSDSPPDPPRDRAAATLPNNIAVLLHATRVLLGYGRHLIDTVRHRAAAPNFNAIAACFGTANLATILAHLNRGILRAEALRRVLLARAATGQDFDFAARRAHAPADSQPGHQAAEAPSRQAAPPRSRPVAWDDPELFMPTPQDLERQVRRRPIGRTILDISLDLALVPGFCTGAFWNELFEIMHGFGGDVAKLMRRKAHRAEAFSQQQDRQPGASWDWLHLQRDAIRQVLGFFIGEPPVNPLDPAAAIATAPP